MKQNKIVKLVYDKYENEVGIIYDVEMNENVPDTGSYHYLHLVKI